MIINPLTVGVAGKELIQVSISAFSSLFFSVIPADLS
jgi:hypothetical protein